MRPSDGVPPASDLPQGISPASLQNAVSLSDALKKVLFCLHWSVVTTLMSTRSG